MTLKDNAMLFPPVGLPGLSVNEKDGTVWRCRPPIVLQTRIGRQRLGFRNPHISGL